MKNKQKSVTAKDSAKTTFTSITTNTINSSSDKTGYAMLFVVLSPSSFSCGGSFPGPQLMSLPPWFTPDPSLCVMVMPPTPIFPIPLRDRWSLVILQILYWKQSNGCFWGTQESKGRLKPQPFLRSEPFSACHLHLGCSILAQTCMAGLLHLWVHSRLCQMNREGPRKGIILTGLILINPNYCILLSSGYVKLGLLWLGNLPSAYTGKCYWCQLFFLTVLTVK